jgi:hypothetical protein
MSSDLFSQKRNITIAPLGLVNKIRIKYENQLKWKEISAGVYGNYYYTYFKGFRLDPFIRFYFFSDEPKGLYLQLKAFFGVFQNDLEYKYYGTTDTLSLKKYSSYTTYGGGPAVGYQWFIHNKTPLDIFVGFNYDKMSAPSTLIKDNQKYDLFDDAMWYITGPGSIFHLHIGIGFKF